MIGFRLVEFGVERLEESGSTFIMPSDELGAWQEFEAWCALGNKPAGSPFNPGSNPGPRPVFSGPKSLLIVGAGGYGREIFGMSQTARGSGREWVVRGFLNDIPDALEGFAELPPIVGGTDHAPGPEEVFICAIGDVAGRKKVCDRLRGRGARFVNLVQPSASLAASVCLGEGVIIEAFTGVGVNSRIGDFSTILSHVSVAHDVRMGSFVQVAPFASILGRAVIGDEVQIGSHAVVLPDITVGAGATVGAGSVVIQNVPEGATVFGVPARQIK